MTWSILARDARGRFGVAIASRFFAVGALCAHTRRGVAFGWYNLAIGLGALPASLIFGFIWDKSSSQTAFMFGAGLALAAAVGMTLVNAPESARQQA